MAKDGRETTFRKLEAILENVPRKMPNNEQKVDVIDIVKTIAKKQNELHFSNQEFMKLISDLKINPSEL